MENDEEVSLGLSGTTEVVKRLYKMASDKKSLYLAGIVLVVAAITTLAGPEIIGYTINHGIEAKNRKVLNIAGAIFVVTIIVTTLLSRIQIRMVARIGETTLRDLRLRLFDHLMKLSLSFFDREATGRLVARMTSDFDAIEDLVQQGLIVFITNGLLFLIALMILAYLSLPLFALSFITLPPLIFLSKWFQRESRLAYLKVRDRIGKTLTTLQEGLAGVKVIQAFGKEDETVELFERQNDAQLGANLKAVSISIKYFPVLESTGVITTAALLGLGGLLVHHHVVTLGTVVAFVLYLNALYDPIQQMSQLFSQVQSSGAALSKIFAIIDTPTETPEPSSPKIMPKEGDFVVDHVSFRYRDDLPYALKDVSLKLNFGERLALVGPTGAGKTTLAKLMARFHVQSEGIITFGGIELKDFTSHDLHANLIAVPQEGFLFAGTVAENIKLAKPEATDDEVRNALISIGALEIIENLPEGLQTEVYERGSQLSAGERQLVSLARAALLKPSILILDEATSNLDPGTESSVEEAMSALSMGRTVVVIAHRLSTAMRADRIAVIAEGRLAEIGTHEELLAQKGVYANLFAAWEANIATFGS
ncbi:MAG: ABC transporter ATP-binding protein [Acidimicrobiales bacterium]|nr:ABC transporter ATP-binding protein [Acidimicrobiales bacterium]